MNELRAVVETLGYTGVGTLGASGNLLFQGSGSDTTGIERRIEGGLMRALALSTQAFVRTAPEWAAIVRRNPFPTEAIEDPAHLTC